MVDALCGTWELVDSQNFEDYLSAIGIGFVDRQVGSLLRPTVVISLDGDKLVLKILSSFTHDVICCKLGEEFDEPTADGRQCKSIITTQGNKLIHVQKWDGKEAKVVREVKDEKMVTTLTVGDVTSIRIFKKL